MLIKVLNRIAAAFLVLVVIAGIAWLFRGDPIGPIAGKGLSGTEAAYPTDWTFIGDHPTCAIEARPEDPHSVTTLCFLYEDALIIPASGPRTKRWPGLVVADARVRIKVDDIVYVAAALRDSELTIDVVREALTGKYPSYGSDERASSETDIWFFRVEPRSF